MDYQLSDKEITSIVKYKTKVITYPELADYSNIKQLFGKYNIILLLYINSEHDNDINGHWCLMTKVKRDGKTIIEFMDPYGYFPDDELSFYTKEWRQKSGQDEKLLTKLLYDFSLNPKHKIYYNEIPFQKESKSVNTCGRWIGIRGHFYKVKLEDFQKIFKKLKKDKYNLDELAVFLSNKLCE